MQRVNLFIVGAAKSGTTSMAKYIEQHPRIFVPALKEPKYFSAADVSFPHGGPGDDLVDARVIKTLDEYESLYAGVGGYAYYADASVDYLYHERVARRLAAYNPDAKIVIMLRNPVARAFSAYMHMVRDGRETLPFREALDAEGERKRRNWEFFWLYKQVGLYSSQVSAYLDAFPRLNVHFIIYDDFAVSPGSVMSELFAFLGIEYEFETDTSTQWNPSGKPKSRALRNLVYKKNPIKGIVKRIVPEAYRLKMKEAIDKKNLVKEQMNEEDRAYLTDFYLPDFKKLEAVTGRDLTRWRHDAQTLSQ